MPIRCLVHAHSNFSYDSPTSLDQIVDLARREGFDVVLMSEHDRTFDDETMTRFVADCARVSGPTLRVVPGIEYSLFENRVHILALGTRTFLKIAGWSVRELADQIRALGGIVVLAHPSHKNAFDLLKTEDLKCLDGMEVWNVRYGSPWAPHVVEQRWLANLRRSGVTLRAFGGIDLHSTDRYRRLVVEVDAPTADEPAILDSLRRGDYRIKGRVASISSSGDLGRSARLLAPFAMRLKSIEKKSMMIQGRLERLGIRVPKPVLHWLRRLF